MNKTLFTAVVFALLALPVLAFADMQMVDGKRLSKTCAGCHGTYGASKGNYIPVIAGQDKDYFLKVMKEFKAGKRAESVEMTLVAKGYSDEQLKNIVGFLSSQKWSNTVHAADSALAKKGVEVNENNSCTGCHGDKGEGMDGNPRLAGQSYGYLIEVLKRYKTGKIESDDMSFMADLSDADIEAVAHYFSKMR